MSVLRVLVTTALVLLVPASAARPSRRRERQFRNPRSHEWHWDSPHLESGDEYELTHDTGTPHLESRCEYEKRTKARVGLT
jgi:hypothetical protein